MDVDHAASWPTLCHCVVTPPPYLKKVLIYFKETFFAAQAQKFSTQLRNLSLARVQLLL